MCEREEKKGNIEPVFCLAEYDSVGRPLKLIASLSVCMAITAHRPFPLFRTVGENRGILKTSLQLFWCRIDINFIKKCPNNV